MKKYLSSKELKKLLDEVWEGDEAFCCFHGVCPCCNNKLAILFDEDGDVTVIKAKFNKGFSRIEKRL